MATRFASAISIQVAETVRELVSASITEAILLITA